MLENFKNTFLKPTNPYSGKRAVNKPACTKAGAGIVAVLIVFACVFSNNKTTQAKALSSAPATTTPSGSIPETPPTDFTKNPYAQEKPKVSLDSRSFGASQLVKRGGNASGGSGDVLPLGTTVRAKLANTVISSDSNSPVIGMFAEDAQFGGTVIIPAGTRVFGQALLDDSSRRLQIRFHTVVFEDGSQAPISAIALQADGSSGLPGSFHSGSLNQQVGRFGGNFVSGLAAGMKEKQSGGLGGPLEPGSVKNGLLNGLSEAASDQAQVFSQEMQNTRPYLEVPMGTGFVLYLEREFDR